MHPIPCLAVAAAAVASAASSGFAQLSYVSQSRTVHAHVNAATSLVDDQSKTAPDFGAFDQTATATITDTYPGSSSVSQSSSLLPSGVSISSTFFANRPTAAGTGNASGESSLNVVFNVDATTPFTLSGLMPATDDAGTPGAAVRSVQLNGPGVAINLTGPGSFNLPGTFTTGQYQLVVDGTYANNMLHPVPTPPGFNVTLQAPEPASLTALLGASALLRRRRRGRRIG